MPGRTQAEHHLTFAGAVRALTTSARAGWGRGRKGGAWAFLRSWWWRRRSGPCGCSLLLIEERLRLPRSCKRSHDAEFRSLRAHPNHYSWRQFGDARGRLTNTSEIRNLAVAHGNRTHRGRLSAPATGFEDRASHQIRKRYREGRYQVSSNGLGRKGPSVSNPEQGAVYGGRCGGGGRNSGPSTRSRKREDHGCFRSGALKTFCQFS